MAVRGADAQFHRWKLIEQRVYYSVELGLNDLTEWWHCEFLEGGARGITLGQLAIILYESIINNLLPTKLVAMAEQGWGWDRV